MKTPIFGPFDVSRSSNLADNRLVNLYPEIVETKDGKAVGALYGCPGLDLLATLGAGPIRGMHVMAGKLYVVSGNTLYAVDATFASVVLGTVASAGAVSMINNGTQLAVFSGSVGFIAPPGRPLTGATIGTAGTGNAVNDVITLVQTGGVQVATASVRVTAVDGAGGVTAFAVVSGGSFTANPASFSQAATTGAGSGLVLTAPTYGASQLFPIVLPFATGPTPIRAAYQDGFGIINQPGTGFIFQSDLLDLSSWPALQFGESSGDPDNVVSVAQIIREIWVIKELHSEIWYNAGTPNFAFALLPGPYIEIGIEAVESLAQSGESLYWLGRNSSGERIVVQTRGHDARRISTHALETAIGRYSSVTDANGYCYQQGGHVFYVLNFPTGDATWVYDVAASAQLGEPVWHQRAALASGLFHRHWGQYHATFAGKAVVGDYRNGNLYGLDLDTLTDNGTQRKWLRSWRALQKPSEEPVRFNALRLDVQTGIGVPDGTNPQIMLRWSDDGGHVWSNEHLAAVGQTGETARRVMFRRLGATRRNTGLDRIFEVSSADPFPVAIIDAELDAA
jgi:hypothetical protein